MAYSGVTSWVGMLDSVSGGVISDNLKWFASHANQQARPERSNGSYISVGTGKQRLIGVSDHSNVGGKHGLTF